MRLRHVNEPPAYNDTIFPSNIHQRAITRTNHTIIRSALCVQVLRAYGPGCVPRASDADVEARLSKMPPALRAALLPFQIEGVRYGLQRHARCLIADEMGVGALLSTE